MQKNVTLGPVDYFLQLNLSDVAHAASGVAKLCRRLAYFIFLQFAIEWLRAEQVLGRYIQVSSKRVVGQLVCFGTITLMAQTLQ